MNRIDRTLGRLPEARDRTGRLFRWLGWGGTRGLSAVVTAVPAAAFVVKGIDAFTMAIKGHDFFGGTLDNAQAMVDRMVDAPSATTRLGGVALETYVAPVIIADTVSEWAGDAIGVSARSNETTGKYGDAAADAAVAAGAGYLAYKVGKNMPYVSRPAAQ